MSKRIYKNSNEAMIKASSKIRGYGYVPINYYCEDMDFHHMHLNGDPAIGIYLPREVHRSIYHDPTTGQGMKDINKAALLWLANQSIISDEVQRKHALMKEKKFKIKSDISLEVWERVGKKGTSGNTYSDVIIQLLDIDDDIERILLDEEPQTEKLKMLKRKWKK